jgi:hypothetical protein
MSSFSRRLNALAGRAVTAVRDAAATVQAEFPAVKDQAVDLARAAGRKMHEYAPKVAADLLDGKLPEVEAVVLAAARRIAPGVGTAATVAVGVARRQKAEKPVDEPKKS